VKVLDFGLARAMAAFDANASTETASGIGAPVTGRWEVLGTVAYMSPEQARNEGVGPRATSSRSACLLRGAHRAASLRLGCRGLDGRPDAFRYAVAAVAHRRGCAPGARRSHRAHARQGTAPRPSAVDVEAELEAAFGTATRSARSDAKASARHTVGRDHALVELRRAFDAAAGGQGAIVASPASPDRQDDAGRRIHRRLGHSGERVYIGRGRCSERQAGAGAYLPWLEALDALRNHGGARWRGR
jgi:hypothetical protein